MVTQVCSNRCHPCRWLQRERDSTSTRLQPRWRRSLPWQLHRPRRGMTGELPFQKRGGGHEHVVVYTGCYYHYRSRRSRSRSRASGRSRRHRSRSRSSRRRKDRKHRRSRSVSRKRSRSGSRKRSHKRGKKSRRHSSTSSYGSSPSPRRKERHQDDTRDPQAASGQAYTVQATHAGQSTGKRALRVIHIRGS